MRPSGIAAALRAWIRAKQPVFIWSSPGCGKCAVTKQVTAGLKLQLRDVRALLLDPADLRSLPFLTPFCRPHRTTNPDALKTPAS